MENIIHSRSTFTSLLFNGKLAHILNPLHIVVDTNQEIITVKSAIRS
jgi:hypothetical protein